jgi:hypothetical protein
VQDALDGGGRDNITIIVGRDVKKDQELAEYALQLRCGVSDRRSIDACELSS